MEFAILDFIQMHLRTDVLAGILLGVVSAILAQRICQWLTAHLNLRLR